MRVRAALPSDLGSRAQLLRTKTKLALGRLVCSAWVGRLVGVLFRDELPSWGLRVDTSGGLVDDRTKAQLFWRLYERGEVRFVRQWLRPDLPVIELGASIGVVSCQILKKLGGREALFAVEADTALAERASANIRRNCGDCGFTVIPCALAYGSGSDAVPFRRGSTSVSGALAGPGEVGAHVIPTRRVTLTSLADELRLPSFSLVADVEGAEADLIFRDASFRSGRCKQVIVELHDTVREGAQLAWGDMVSEVRAAGFRLDAQRGPVCVFSWDEGSARRAGRA